MSKSGQKIHERQMQLPLDGVEQATDLMKAVAMKAPVKKKMKRDFSPEEIEEIERGVARDKDTAEELKKEQTEEAKAQRERIIRIKKIAKEMEKGNNDKIILFPSYSRKNGDLKWYKMGDFSALYYTYRMADRMGRRVKIMKDTDKFAKMEYIASVKGAEKFIEQAMRLNEFARYEETVDGFYILYLKTPLSDTDMGILRRTERERKEMMHNVLKPKKADPAVYQAILLLDRQLLPRTAKMPGGYYRTIGDRMAMDLMTLTQVYFGYADGYVEVGAAKEELTKIVDDLRAGAALLGENNVWAYDVATSVGENINDLRKRVGELK